MGTYNTTDKLPKGIKRLADLSVYINGEWVKDMQLGHVTARQMVNLATKIAKRVARDNNAEHVAIYAAFGCLHLAEIVVTPNGATLEIPASSLRCLLNDIEEMKQATNSTPETLNPSNDTDMNTDTTPATMNENNNKYNALANSINAGTTIVNTVSVARSGMSRKYRFYGVNASGRLIWLNADIAELLNIKMDNDGNITRRGCGMDFACDTLMCVASRLRTLGYECEYNSYQRI